MATLPAPPRGPAGGHAGVADEHRCSVAQTDAPALAVRPGADGAEVATETDHGVAESFAEPIREPALAHPAEVDCATARQCRSATVDVEHRGERRTRYGRFRCRAVAIPPSHLLDAPVVSGGDERGEDRGVDEALAERVRVERDAQQRFEQRRHRHGAA